MKKITFGYEIVVKTNTLFREEFFRTCIEKSIEAIKPFAEEKKTKIFIRHLQPDELPI